LLDFPNNPPSVHVFKHILIATDGSRLAAKGAGMAIKLARALGAKVTGVCVIEPYPQAVYGEAAFYYTGPTVQELKKGLTRHARKALATIETQAKSAGVACATHVVTAPRPFEGILRAARGRRCDLIAMASHGRGGLGGLILGSETAKVLAHSKIPVLVLR
jgi:nucleotide-binding universal stress UspA family protein